MCLALLPSPSCIFLHALNLATLYLSYLSVLSLHLNILKNTCWNMAEISYCTHRAYSQGLKNTCWNMSWSRGELAWLIAKDYCPCSYISDRVTTMRPYHCRYICTTPRPSSVARYFPHRDPLSSPTPLLLFSLFSCISDVMSMSNIFGNW